MATVDVLEAGVLVGSVEGELVLEPDGMHLTLTAPAPKPGHTLRQIVDERVGAKGEGWKGKVFNLRASEGTVMRTYEGCQIVSEDGANQRILFVSSKT